MLANFDSKFRGFTFLTSNYLKPDEGFFGLVSVGSATELLLFDDMDAYDRHIFRPQGFDDEVPTSVVSEASESEDEGEENIISEHDTDTG